MSAPYHSTSDAFKIAVAEYFDEYPDDLSELLETGSVTISVLGLGRYEFELRVSPVKL